jgi:hypothetical protein
MSCWAVSSRPLLCTPLLVHAVFTFMFVECMPTYCALSILRRFSDP